MQENQITSEHKCECIEDFADSIKAEQIERLDIRQKTSIADFFILCTATSDTHLRAILGKVEEKMKEMGIRPLRSDVDLTGWGLLDYGDVIFHAMLEEKRQFYDLETLWTEMQTDPNLQ